jgi:hypothetical protein
MAARRHGVPSSTPLPATARQIEVPGSYRGAVQCLCARKEGERWSRVESTEQGSPVSSAGALASDSRGWWPYHGEPRRARDVRGGDGARSEMEESAVSGGGRNGQLQRARAGGGGSERVRVLCCC